MRRSVARVGVTTLGARDLVALKRAGVVEGFAEELRGERE